ncbi:MAG: sugar phosphate isomerase/epimerase [Planctomycetota bacterium]|nr:MAG: sugar phosphate isomerase/epimerase [Planctomycetota bacterium]
MKPAVAQVCSLESAFERDIEDYAAGACSAIELWLGKLEGFLEQHTAAEVRELLASHGLVAPVASFQGGLLTSQGERRREHWDHFARRLDLLREIGVETLVVAADIGGPLTQEDIDRVTASLAEAAAVALAQPAARAASSGVRLAVEFQARASFMNNLQTAAAVIADLGSPHVGLCLDAFHYYVGPSKPEDLAYLSAANVFHVQVCDLPGVAREFASDSDRVLPGDGDIPLEPLVAALKAIRYDGYVSVELMNPQIWRVPARQFGEIAMTAVRKLLGLARME